jgi:hypothetical protein
MKQLYGVISFVIIGLLLLSGCASKDMEVKKEVDLNKYNVTHPLYMSFDDNLSDIRDTPKGLSYRLDNFALKNIPKNYGDMWTLWTIGETCNKKYKNFVDIEPDYGDSFLINGLGGIMSFGILPILGGFMTPTDCIYDKNKISSYIKKDLVLRPINRRKILGLYNREFELISDIKNENKKIAQILDFKYIAENQNKYRTQEQFPCHRETCIDKIKHYDQILNNIKAEKKSIYRNLQDDNSLNNIFLIATNTKEAYVKNSYLLPYIRRYVKNADVKKIYAEASQDFKIYLEPLIFKRVVNINNIEMYNWFKKHYPKSKFMQNINDKLAMKHRVENINNIFYNKWNSLEWEGKFDQQNWPQGKGTFTMSKTLTSSIWIDCYVNTDINNHEIGNGDLGCVLRKRAYIISFKNISSKHKAHFHGIDEMNEELRTNANRAIKEYNGKIEKNTQSNSRCNTLYKTCMSYCDKKSTKGFFDDKSSCQNSCITGKNSCEEGNFYVSKIISCKGICKGCLLYTSPSPRD